MDEYTNSRGETRPGHWYFHEERALIKLVSEGIFGMHFGVGSDSPLALFLSVPDGEGSFAVPDEEALEELYLLWTYDPDNCVSLWTTKHRGCRTETPTQAMPDYLREMVVNHNLRMGFDWFEEDVDRDWRNRDGVNRLETITLSVNANDLFTWAASESVDIPDMAALESYYHTIKTEPKYGSWKWACKHENLQPQNPVADLMREAGVWDSEMDALRPNNWQCMAPGPCAIHGKTH